MWDKDLAHIIYKHSRENGFRIEDILNIEDKMLQTFPVAFNKLNSKGLNGYIFYLDANLGRKGKIEVATKTLRPGVQEIIHIQYMGLKQYKTKIKKLKKSMLVLDNKKKMV